MSKLSIFVTALIIAIVVAGIYLYLRSQVVTKSMGMKANDEEEEKETSHLPTLINVESFLVKNLMDRSIFEKS